MLLGSPPNSCSKPAATLNSTYTMASICRTSRCWRVSNTKAQPPRCSMQRPPAVALFMAATPPPGEGSNNCCDDHSDATEVPDGLLLAIQRPETTLEPFDPRTLANVVNGLDRKVGYY